MIHKISFYEGRASIGLDMPDPCTRGDVLDVIDRLATHVDKLRWVFIALMVIPVVYAAVGGPGYISLAVMLLLIVALHALNCGDRELARLLKDARRCAEGMDCDRQYNHAMLRDVFAEMRNSRKPTMAGLLFKLDTLVMPVLCGAICTWLVLA